MSARVDWNGPAARAAIEQQVSARIKSACIALTRWIRTDISQSGTLDYEIVKHREIRGKVIGHYRETRLSKLKRKGFTKLGKFKLGRKLKRKLGLKAPKRSYGVKKVRRKKK